MWNQLERGRQGGPGPVETPRGRTLPDSAGARADDASLADSAGPARGLDAIDALTADDAAYAALTERAGDVTPATAPLTETMRRAQARAMIREFLRAVPRSEPETVLALDRADGAVHTLTRAELSVAIDRLRPRMRQIIRLGIEERWPRQKVCEYLRGISMKTLERDQVEALDLLASL